MTAKTTALLAIQFAALLAGIIGVFTTGPEILLPIIVGIFALIISSLIVCGLWLVPAFKTSPLTRQRRVIWIAAFSTSVLVGLSPLGSLFLFRK